MYNITIDAGTSNTRATLWHDWKMYNSVAKAVGCRDTAITGSRERLLNGVQAALTELVDGAGLTYRQINAVLTSGMISSNMGLAEIPHISLPAGREEIARALVAKDIPQVWPKPIWFVPGLKQSADSNDWLGLSVMDIMRGEETEAIALIERLGLTGPAWIALPGSHSKYLYINDDQKVERFVTTLAGELYSAVAGNTILADSVAIANISGMLSKDLLAGAELAASMGLGKACFMVRLAHLFGDKNETERGDFLLGAILSSDIQSLKQVNRLVKAKNSLIAVAGRKELRTAVVGLLRNEKDFGDKVMEVDDQDVQNLAGYGALILARQRGILI